MTSPRRVRASVSRLWTALAVLALIGQAVVSLHMGLTRHVRCAAHGELIHGSHDGDAVAAAPPSPTPIAQVRGQAESDEHQHDHCQALAAAPGATVRPLVGWVVVVLSPVLAPPRSAPRAPAFATYRLAPKASPPALG